MKTAEFADNGTIALMRYIGSPFVASHGGKIAESSELHNLAQKNNLGMLYLEALERVGCLEKLRPEYESGARYYKEFCQAMARVHRLFTEKGIEYTFFKSIKPYIAWGKDADAMVLGNHDMFEDAVMVLVRSGYELGYMDGTTPRPSHFNNCNLGPNDDRLNKMMKVAGKASYGRNQVKGVKGYVVVSPAGLDLIDSECKIAIDLQWEFATSYIIWMDKARWAGKVERVRLQNGEEVNTLAPQLEMVVLIAHALIDQSYRLGDYYTFIYYLSSLPDESLAVFIREVRDNCMVRATRSFLALTAMLHHTAHGFVPQRLLKMSAELGESSDESVRLARRGYCTPYRYSWGILLWTVVEKLCEKKFAASMVRQGWHMLNPRLTRQVFLEIRERTKAF